MRGPFAALSERFGRRRQPGDRAAAAAPSEASPRPAPLTADMAYGAGEMQARLEQARTRLKRDIAPPDDDAV